jgi:hypothetical protein
MTLLAESGASECQAASRLSTFDAALLRLLEAHECHPFSRRWQMDVLLIFFEGAAAAGELFQFPRERNSWEQDYCQWVSS